MSELYIAEALNGLPYPDDTDIETYVEYMQWASEQAGELFSNPELGQS